MNAVATQGAFFRSEDANGKGKVTPRHTQVPY